MPRSSSPSSPPWSGLYYVGIDENGMGPRLGPMIVTSLLARATPGLSGGKLATSKPRGALAARIGDSKKLVAFDDSTLGEAWARAIVARTARTESLSSAFVEHALPPPALPLTPAELLVRISLDSDAELRAPCPDHHQDLCWGSAGETFASDDAMVASCMKDLDRLEARGLEILRVRVASTRPSPQVSRASMWTFTRWSA